MDKRPYVAQSQLLNEQSNEITCGETHDDGSIAATVLSSQMDFQTMKAANDTAKVSVTPTSIHHFSRFKLPIYCRAESQNAAQPIGSIEIVELLGG